MHASVLRPRGVGKVNFLLQTALGCDLGFRVCLRSRDVVKALGAWPKFQAWPEWGPAISLGVDDSQRCGQSLPIGLEKLSSQGRR